MALSAAECIAGYLDATVPDRASTSVGSTGESCWFRIGTNRWNACKA